MAVDNNLLMLAVNIMTDFAIHNLHKKKSFKPRLFVKSVQRKERNQ